MEVIMLLKEILQVKGSKVWSIESHRTLSEALQLLIQNKIGALLVFTQSKKIVGILSERDVLRICFSKPQDWGQVAIESVMTEKVIIVSPNDDVNVAMSLMTEKRIRHIPVADNGKLCGIVSIGDVVKARLDEYELENQAMKEYIAGP